MCVQQAVNAPPRVHPHMKYSIYSTLTLSSDGEYDEYEHDDLNVISEYSLLYHMSTGTI